MVAASWAWLDRCHRQAHTNLRKNEKTSPQLYDILLSIRENHVLSTPLLQHHDAASCLFLRVVVVVLGHCHTALHEGNKFIRFHQARNGRRYLRATRAEYIPRRRIMQQDHRGRGSKKARVTAGRRFAPNGVDDTERDLCVCV
jgi:hypothetical protein